MSTEKLNISIKFTMQEGAYDDEISKSDLGEIEVIARFGKKLNIEELEKTKEEKTIIKNVNSAIKILLDELSLPIIQASEKMVHILSPAEYDRVVRPLSSSPNTNDALFVDGRIYIQRSSNEIDLVFDLSHEIAHELSFLKTRATVSKRDGIRFVELGDICQRGYGFCGKNSKIFGVGFNEGVTEMFAHAIRYNYSVITNQDEQNRERLRNYGGYYPQIILLGEMAYEIEPENHAKIFDLYFTCFIDGKNTAIRKVGEFFKSKNNPQGLKIFMAMEGNCESALKAAKKGSYRISGVKRTI